MKTKIALLVWAFLVFLSAHVVNAQQSGKVPIIGIWRLVSFEMEYQATGQREKTRGNNPAGVERGIRKKCFAESPAHLGSNFSQIRSHDREQNHLRQTAMKLSFMGVESEFFGQTAGTMDTNMDTNEKEAIAEMP